MARAAPLYTALDELFTFKIACVKLTLGLQAEIVPSSVTKIKIAGLPGVTSKSSFSPLKTTPVGVAEALLPGTGGMVTTRGDPVGNACPEPLYRVETLVPLSAIQKGPVELWTMPHEFTR